MLRSLCSWVVLVVLLAGCGDDAGSGGGSADSAVAGAYVGSIDVQTDVPADSVFTSAEIEIAADGSITGTVTTKTPTSAVGEAGTVSGSLSEAGVASFDADLVIELETLGTFSAAGSLSYGEELGILTGLLSARDEAGAIVGSTIVNVHQE